MKWQLLEPHHIDEQVLPAGTVIGDDTQWPYRATYNEKKNKFGGGVDRKIGDPLPPSRAMTPMDDEARKVYDDVFGGEIPNPDPTRSIPLTGAPDSPKVAGPGSKPPPASPQPVNSAPKDDAPKTGMAAKPPLSPSTPQPALKPELQKPSGHDSSKNPGDSKDTETAKAPDINKLS